MPFTRRSESDKPPPPPPQIPGAEWSAAYSTYTCTSGLSSLDGCIGGGIPLGCLAVVETCHALHCGLTLARCFLSSGLHHGSPCATNLPHPLPAVTAATPPGDDSRHEGMKIAWRYERGKRSGAANSLEYNFDKTIDNHEALTRVSLDSDVDESLHAVSRFLTQSQSIVSPNTAIRASKLCLAVDDYHPALSRLLFGLKGLLRSSACACILLIPSFLPEVERNVSCAISDLCVKFEPLIPTSDNRSDPVFKEYEGCLTFRKTCCLNTLRSPCLATDRMYSVKRRQLLVQPGNLLPDQSETASRTDRRPELATRGPPAEMF